MTKTSLIAIIWVWHCVTYGQLSANNPYYFPYIPYISTFVTQSHNQQNYDETVDQLGGNAGELLERNSPFQGALFIRIRRLEAITANLAKQLKDVKDELKTMSTSEIVDSGQMPTSCADLQRMGHKLSGFFSVKGSKKMEMIYCDFNPNQNEKQKWIGYVDVKSAPVHFYVLRESPFFTKGTPIPFDFALVNEGNAMDLATGKFSAPRPGIYFFSFTGVAFFPASTSAVQLEVSLFLNGGRIGMGWVGEANTVANQYSPLTLQSTLNLKKGDQVWLMIFYKSTGAYLDDDSRHVTHFTGFALEEEIVASL